ncbi:DPH2 [[Candida] subhashii]|uniref:2-(3-amino-3-carboxypropyl)histidine synthase subunit 2 n=1 Tax=[Candida] subhashii TaxID=561895 RepID=A0A8J5QNP7_9ASCO|nr:DPH2 [[Candida] subhashii]KAG7665128.1 DPH2 [[Candida] subhashii]
MATSEEIVAPSLSTYQDESTFITFDEIKSTKKERPYLGLQNPDDPEELKSKIYEYYSLTELIKFLNQKQEDGEVRYKRITLQFPDSLIPDSATIVYELQRELRLEVTPSSSTPVESNESCGCGNQSQCDNKSSRESGQRLWILADTSYSSCCVDEVAAEHVHSDLVVHFGDACLNDIDKLPAVYILGKPKVDLDKLLEQFKSRYEDKQGKIVLMADAPHTWIFHDLYNCLKDEYPNVVIADLYINPNSKANIIGYTPSTTTTSTGLQKFNRQFSIDNNEVDFSEYDLFHITQPATPRLLQLTTTFSSVTIFHPTTNTTTQGPYPNLMRRYKFMHIARSAGTVGLLVNTLSLTHTKTLIQSIAQKVKSAGKKHYVFVVGKPNVAKLANFESVDIWCVVGCDQGGIVVDETNEYFRPIVTPYELVLALSDELTWTGKWIVDYKSVLENLQEVQEEEGDEGDEGDEDEDAPPEFDAVTGRMVSTSRPLRQINHLMISATEEEEDGNSNTKQLVEKFSNVVAIKNTISTSAIHLQNRHWSGLGSDFQENNNESDEEGEGDEGTLVEEGRGGIARGYDFDRDVHS